MTITMVYHSSHEQRKSIERLDWKKPSSTVDESERSPEKAKEMKLLQSKNTGNPSRHHQFQILDSPKTILDVDYDLLKSGIAILPGSRDLDGRSVVFIFTNGQFWKNQLVSSMELARLLMYYKTVPREEVQRRGLTIIAIIKGASPSTVNTLLQTFMVFEDNCPDTLSAVHLLTDRHVEPLVLNSPVYDPSCSYQVLDIMTKMYPWLNLLLNTDMLLQYMSYDQLPPVLDGHFPHHHEEWIRFHMQLDPFVAKLHTMADYLMYVIQGICDIETIPSTAEELSQLVLHHDNILKSLFQDERFISIRSEGEGVMKCLKREEVQIGHTEDYRDAMLYVTKLHDQVESTLVKLSRLADKRLAKLESILQLKEFKEECEKEDFFTELYKHPVIVNACIHLKD
ncbi:hypothetical protein KUTeg_018991 [Tegillarca granosa]|uniref:Uncharacterized protein n=1 Tax=Tegillarca granosa TaxID=220873 RepID=A0ABQ9EGN1_TEGGR|nr:hypothetical protein KUTeg_018991 [Tegillarca granosa]